MGPSSERLDVLKENREEGARRPAWTPPDTNTRDFVKEGGDHVAAPARIATRACITTAHRQRKFGTGRTGRDLEVFDPGAAVRLPRL
jgi:hypothetical protein